MALGMGTDFRFDIFARDRSRPEWRGVENSVQRTRGLRSRVRVSGVGRRVAALRRGSAPRRPSRGSVSPARAALRLSRAHL